MEASPPSFACVLEVDWSALPLVGCTLNCTLAPKPGTEPRFDHTESGRASSRPEGAASWTLPGTAESPWAWDLPCPYSLVEDILMVLRKIGVDRTIGRAKVRSLSDADMLKER